MPDETLKAWVVEQMAYPDGLPLLLKKYTKRADDLTREVMSSSEGNPCEQLKGRATGIRGCVNYVMEIIK